jgi:hypothetical protein
MSARTDTEALQMRLWAKFGVNMSYGDAQTLRRAAITLRRWFEGECGDNSGVIFRDDSGKPFRESYAGVRVAIRDMEAGALRRVQDVCSRYGVQHYISMDPRGEVLHIGRGMDWVSAEM